MTAHRTRLFPLVMTCVYRLYDAAGRLLYVGVAYDFDVRFRQHARFKDWWPQVARKDVIWFDSRYDALYEEARAIDTEGPIHNEKVGTDPIGLMIVSRTPPDPFAVPRSWAYPVPERELLVGRRNKQEALDEVIEFKSHALVTYEAEPFGVAVPMDWYLNVHERVGLDADLSGLLRIDPEMLCDGRRALDRPTGRRGHVHISSSPE